MIFRKAIIAAAIAAATIAGPASAEAPKIVLAPPGVPPIFGSIIVFVAQDQGFFKKYGADVELRPFDNGTAASRAVVAGDLDASLSSTPLMITQVANADVPVVAMYGFPKPDFELATTDGSKATCNDLKGQQVGIDTPGGARSLALQSILTGFCHMTINDVQQVAMGSNTASAMIAGQLRYGILHLDDVPDIENHGKKVTVMQTLAQASPINHWLVLIARKDHLKEKRDGYVRMLAGIIAAGKFMADPKNADRVAKIAEVTGRSHAEALAAFQGYMKYGLWSINDDGLDKGQLDKLIAFQAKIGKILPGKTPPTFEQIVDPSVYRDAEALVEKTK